MTCSFLCRIIVLSVMLLSGIAPLVLSAQNVDGQPGIDIAFDQVEIRNCVKLIGELTGRTFVVDDGIKGKVTVVAPKVAIKDVYPLFIKILESVGCAAVEEGNVIRIVPFAGRANANAPILVEGATPSQFAGLITRIIRLHYASAGDIRRVLEAMSGRERSGTVASIDNSNHLIITDTPANITRIDALVRELDRPGAAITFDVVPLKNLDATEFAEQLMPALNRNERQREGQLAQLPDRAATRSLSVVAAPNVNSLVLVGNAAEVAELKKTILQVDEPRLAGKGNLHVIFLKFLAADEAAKSLKALLGYQTQGTPQRSGRQQTGTQTPVPVINGGTSDRRIAIEAISAKNALLIDAGPRDFEMINQLVEQLDTIIDQVLIEVVIAEMSLTDDLNLGVEMYTVATPSTVGNTVIQGSSILNQNADNVLNSIQNGVFPNGLTFGVARGTSTDSSGKTTYSYPAVFNINALKKNGKFKILSSVPLLSQNNREASVSVVNNIPILKSTISGGSGTARDIIQNIDRYDVGIKLKMTPHVNPDGQVNMVLNPSIEAIIDPGTSGSYTPTIAKREVSTTITVPDGQTIVITGLIREDETDVVRKVPILGDIPLIRFFFTNSSKSKQRTNLLVFVTPHLIKSVDTARSMTASMEARTGLSSSTNATPVR